MQRRVSPTDAVRLHVALAGHAVPPQSLVGEAARQTVLHPVVSGCGDHQQDVSHDGAKQAPSHEAVHHECHCSRGSRHAVHGGEEDRDKHELGKGNPRLPKLYCEETLITFHVQSKQSVLDVFGRNE